MLLLCGLLFVISIYLLFTQEKRGLDEEFENMIAFSLNIHTNNNALQINGEIADASSSLRAAEFMLRNFDTSNPQNILEHFNATGTNYEIAYVTGEDIEARALLPLLQEKVEQSLQGLTWGEMLVGDIYCHGPSEGHYLSLIMPLGDGNKLTGALYTFVPVDQFLPEIVDSSVYKDVQNCIISNDGNVVFNTFTPGRRTNFFADLIAYGLSESDTARIADLISNQERGSATFERKGFTYFVASAPLEYNDWHLVSFVRGPDVLLRSTNFFRVVLRTSIIAILLTIAAGCFVFTLFLSSKKKLEQEQQRSAEFALRFKAMFEQHSALKVVLDSASGEIVDANPAVLSYFGYTKEEVLGRKGKEFNLLPPKKHDEIFQREFNGEALFSAAPYRLKNGEIKLMDVHASLVVDGGRNLLYAILFDVTDREHYRNKLLQEKELLKTTVQSIGDGVITTDNRGMITSINSAAEQLIGWDNQSVLGKAFEDVFILQNEETDQPLDNLVQKVLGTGQVIGFANHTELVNRRGERIPIADSAAPIKAEDGEILGVVMVFRDVSKDREHSKEIEFLSYHDPLTSLYNRRYIEEAMNRLEGEKHLPVSVIMADVNGLKITNDIFGHRAGDALLKSVAELLKAYCKKTDLIARWGGDEFVVVMPGAGLKEAEAVIGEIKNHHVVFEAGNLSLSLSLGCACKDTEEKSIQTAMQQAEEYMYHQKLLEGKSYRSAIINTLLATLYEKSNETEEHSKRLEKYCHAVGRELQLSSREMDALSLLALLHDIGKVSIDPNILKKPGALTPVEWNEMRRHPEIGYRIAQTAPELAPVADLILSHHERWDGTGYPHGLKGTEIPLICRILAVADAYDAMINDRAYRSAKSNEEAIDELMNNAGIQFDPAIVRIFLQSLKLEK